MMRNWLRTAFRRFLEVSVLEAPPGSSRRPRPARTIHLHLEALEHRFAPAAVTYTVTSNTDTGTGAGTSGDLIYCINQANANNGGGDVIQFNLGSSGIQTITIKSSGLPIPTITDAGLTIDGTTEPGYSGTPLVDINGANHFQNGLVINASNVTVKGLAIESFGRSGVVINGGGGTNSDDVVISNYIGVDASGAFGGNGNNGISLTNGAFNDTIGATAAGDGNVISNNSGIGISLNGADSNIVEGNFIGTDPIGANAMGNGTNGITINGGSTNNVIGGTLPGSANIISGNGADGININGGGASGNIVEGNLIGVNAGNNAALPNTMGVIVNGGANSDAIGGVASGAGNVIAGNSAAGISINGASNIVVEGNTIGNAAASNPIGVLITGGASDNIIGGTSAAAGNVIAGNTTDGISITGGGTSGNVVEGNSIGVSAVLNNPIGVLIAGGANANTVGGATAGAGNIIVGNTTAGISVTGGAANNLIQGNSIGVNALGNAIPNLVGVNVNGATATTIGGSTPTAGTGPGNIIAGNTSAGISIAGGGTSATNVDGNLIGLNAAGTALSNGVGVLLTTGAGSGGANFIGGITATAGTGLGNVIAGNLVAGVQVTGGPTTRGNTVDGNVIGLNAAGIALGNGIGVIINGAATGNTIGGTATGAANVISGNTAEGLVISDAGTRTNTVDGNLIGTNAAGTTAIGNGSGTATVSYVAITNGGAGYSAGTTSVAFAGANGSGSGATGTAVVAGGAVTGILITSGGSGYTMPLTVTILSSSGGTGATASAVTGGNGIVILNLASNNLIGGPTNSTAPLNGARNIISGNTGDGVLITDGTGVAATSTTGNSIVNNAIGANLTGTAELPNNLGVLVQNGATGNFIGGEGPPLEGNVIAYNTTFGVEVTSSTTIDNLISANSITGNGGLGISLAGYPAIPPPGGPNIGPNDFQNYPILNPYDTAGTVTGTLNSTPNTTFILEFFANQNPDPSGFGQGQNYLPQAVTVAGSGATLTPFKVTTNAYGNATFSYNYTPIAGAPFLTATATDPNNNTSQFSPWVDGNLLVTNKTFTSQEGSSYSGVVATFTDADTSATANGYTAVINWGDGTATTTGTITGTAGGIFTVSASQFPHTYLEESAAPLHVTVTITDVASGGVFVANSLAQVPDAPLTATAIPVNPAPPEAGSPFSQALATFTDADPNGTLADWSATVAWGDGTFSSTGGVTGVTITNGGSGYTTPTTIAAGSNGDSLPAGTIDVASTTGFAGSGTILVTTSAGTQTVTYTGTTPTSFTGCSGGTGVMGTGGAVTIPPIPVTFSGGGGSGAAGILIVSTSGGVTGVTMTSPGSGYTSTPTVTFPAPSGATGTAATGYAVTNITNSGSVFSVTVGFAITATFNSGSSVLTLVDATSGLQIGQPITGAGIAPSTTITGFSGDSAGSQVTLSVSTTAGSGSTGEQLNVTSGGVGYGSAPTVIFSGGGGTGAAGFATVTNGVVTSVTVTNGGAGYTSAPTVTLTGGGGTGAIATAALNGTVTSVNVTNGGSGYSAANPPNVTFVGGGGTGAAGVATVVNGVVTGITITNVGSGYSSTPTVVFSSGNAIATATLSFTVTTATIAPNSNGGFNVSSGHTYFAAGTYTLTVTINDVGGASTSVTSTVVVPPQTANHLVFLQQPSTTVAGGTMKPAVVVQVLDAFNNLVVADNIDVVKLALFTNPGKATLSGTLSATVTSGTATFSNLSINNAGVGYVMSATSGTLPVLLSNAFNISPTTHFAINGPRTTVAGTTYQIVVSARTATNQPDSSYRGTVFITSTDKQALINGLPPSPAGYSFPAAANGVQIFTVTLKTAGSQSITVTDGSLGSVIGKSTLTVAPGPTSTFAINYPANAVSGVAHSFTVTAKDAYGNVATNFVGTVNLTATSVPAGVTLTGASSHSYTATNKGVFTYVATLTASSGVVASLTATEASVPAVSATESINLYSLTPTIAPVIAGQFVAVPGQPVAYTLTATAGPVANTAKFTYTVSFNGITQTFSGPNGMTITHVFTAVDTTGPQTVSITKVIDPSGSKTGGGAGASLSMTVAATEVEVDPDPSLPAGTKALFIGAPLSGTNNVVISPSGAGNIVTVTINGASVGGAGGASNPISHIYVYGQGGKDTFTETSVGGVQVAIPAVVLSGSGTNVINLAQSAANNILVGGPGNDSITGGSQRDILIGMGGTDTLTAGSGDDLMIGGTTTLSTNLLALLAIGYEWFSTDSFATRVADILGLPDAGGLMLNGSYFLNNTTVHTDLLPNLLTGSTGAAFDWLFLGVSDIVSNLKPGDQITPI
jgi:titin